MRSMLAVFHRQVQHCAHRSCGWQVDALTSRSTGRLATKHQQFTSIPPTLPSTPAAAVHPVTSSPPERYLLVVTGASRGFGACFAAAVINDPRALAPSANTLDIVLLASDPGRLSAQVVHLTHLTHLAEQHHPPDHHPSINIVSKAFDLGNLDDLEKNVGDVLRSQANGGVLPAAHGQYASVTALLNAGTTGDLVLLKDQTLANIRRQMDVNVTSLAFLTARLLATFTPSPASAHQVPPPHNDVVPTTSTGLQQQQPGSMQASVRAVEPSTSSNATSCGTRELVIVNVSSVSVGTPYEAFSIYSAGKAARHMIVQSVALEASLTAAAPGVSQQHHNDAMTPTLPSTSADAELFQTATPLDSFDASSAAVQAPDPDAVSGTHPCTSTSRVQSEAGDASQPGALLRADNTDCLTSASTTCRMAAATAALAVGTSSAGGTSHQTQPGVLAATSTNRSAGSGSISGIGPERLSLHSVHSSPAAGNRGHQACGVTQQVGQQGSRRHASRHVEAAAWSGSGATLGDATRQGHPEQRGIGHIGDAATASGSGSAAAAAFAATRCDVRAFSYAPGAIDTDMQTAAREALPAGLPLKLKFEENHAQGKLVNPATSAIKLLHILRDQQYRNGDHLSYYGGSDATGGHPLSRS